MRITVIGGSQGTGAQVVAAALGAGHQVTSVSRSGGGESREGVREVFGDALDPDVLRDALTDAEAVVVTVGGSGGADRHRSRVTGAVIAAMKAQGVRRLVVQSSLGVGDSMALMPAAARLFARTVLPKALADHADQEAAVVASGLEWTVVRPGGLTNGPAGGPFVALEGSSGGQIRGPIARADVAAYIVAHLDDPATFHRAIALGGG